MVVYIEYAFLENALLDGTLLYVTHDIQEARRIGQNFIEFKKEEATD